MAQPLDIRGVAELTDHVSPTLARIGVTMAAIARNPALQRVAAQTAAVGQALRGVGQSVRTVAANFAAVGIIGGTAILAVGAAAAKVTQRFAETGSEISDSAKRIGISAEKLQEWRYAADRSGASSQTLETGLQALNKRIGDVARGKAKQTAALFKKLGISVKDAKGKIKPLEELLPQLAEAFRKNEDPAKRAAMAAALGGAAFADLIPMLAGGKKSLQDMANEARSLGIIIPDADVERASSLSDSFKDLGKAVRGLGLTIGAELAPVIQPVIEKMKDWIKQNREWMATKISEYVKDFIDYVKSIDFSRVQESFTRFKDAAIELKDKLGGVDGVLTAIGIALGLPGFLALGNTAVQMARLAGAVAALNPPAAGVVAGILALGYAAWEVYNNWDEVKAKLEQIWEGLKTKSQSVADEMSASFKQIADAFPKQEEIPGLAEIVGKIWAGFKSDMEKAPGDFQAMWENLSKGFSGWGDRTATAFATEAEPLRNKIAEIAAELGPSLSSIWTNMKGGLEGWGARTAAAFGVEAEPLKVKIAGIAEEFRSSAGSMWENIKSSASQSWSDTLSTVQNFIEQIKAAIEGFRKWLSELSFSMPTISMPSVAPGTYSRKTGPTPVAPAAPAPAARDDRQGSTSTPRFGSLIERQREQRRTDLAQAMTGRASVDVNFKNAPPGTTAKARTSGTLFAGVPADLDMGYAMGGVG